MFKNPRVIVWCCLILQLGQWQANAASPGSACNLSELEKVRKDGSLPDYQLYKQTREKILACEQNMELGNSETLTETEKLANSAVMSMKRSEYIAGLKNPHEFVPSHSIMDSLDKVNKSPLFQFIKNMPKGGQLQAHEGTIGTKQFFLDLTQEPNVWVCWRNKSDSLSFHMTYYANKEPVSTGTKLFNCKWSKMADLRAERGKEVIDNLFLAHLSLENLPRDASETEAVMFIHFGVFLIKNLVLYQPNWEKYLKFMLQQSYNDGVQYLELRVALLPLYTLDGVKLPRDESLKVYNKVFADFKKAHPDFYGAKVILSPLRFLDLQDMTHFVGNYSTYKTTYPNLIAGFDMIGPETVNTTINRRLLSIFKLPKDVNFYFHAGETTWYGTTVDDNLIDAALLRSKRIGGAYALVKRPLAMQMVKDLKIGLEISPISDQAHKRVKDLRNHPLAVLLANDYPVVLSSDISMFTGTSVMSHDLYNTFLGIASARADLRFLKKLVKNSFEYSSLPQNEKLAALRLWEKKWNDYLKKFNAEFKKSQMHN